MAAIIQPIALVSMLGLYSDPILPGQVEGSSQTFKKGVPLVWSSGKIVEASANPTAIVGISSGPGQNLTTSPGCNVIPVLKSLVFEISIDVASGGNAGGTGSLTTANIGTTYGITKDGASSQWYLDTAKNAANQVLTLIGFQTNATSGSNDSGVVNGRGLVIFLASTSVWT